MQKTQPQQTSTTQLSHKNKSAEFERIDKFVSNQISSLSRSDVKQLLKKGKITVNNAVIKAADFKINPQLDCVCVNGEEVFYRKHIYIMLNKPQGVVCSTKDGLSKTVLSLVPDELMRKGLFPAGRLDKDTEGFVLITDDGDFAHKILSPKNHIPKLYFARLEKNYENDYAEKFENGITLITGEDCLSAKFLAGKTQNECYVVLHEGMYHQVKKMFEALGNKVVYLKRIAMGGMKLDENLALGECVEILHKNVEKFLEQTDITAFID